MSFYVTKSKLAGLANFGQWRQRSAFAYHFLLSRPIGNCCSPGKTHGAEGVVYPEPLDIWGLCCVAPRPDGLCGAEHLTYHYSMMLEHAWMSLQAHDRLEISISKDLLWIEGTVKFCDTFYRNQTLKLTGKQLGDDGKLDIYPAPRICHPGVQTGTL